MPRFRGLIMMLLVSLALSPLLLGTAKHGKAQDVAPSPGATAGTATTLFDVILEPEQRPATGTQAVFWRSTWAPGAIGSASLGDQELLVPAGETTAGTRIDYVQSGSIAVWNATDPMMIYHHESNLDGNQAPEVIAAPNQIELEAGDVAVYPVDSIWTGSSPSSEPVVLLTAIIGSSVLNLANVPDAYTGVVFDPLGLVWSADWAAIPPGPLEVTLQRLIKEPEGVPAELKVTPSAAQILVVESGEMEVRDFLVDGTDLGSVIVRKGDRAPLPFPDQATRSIGVYDPDNTAVESLVYLALDFKSLGPPIAVPSSDEPTATTMPQPTVVTGAHIDEIVQAGNFALIVTELERSTDPINGVAPAGEYARIRIAVLSMSSETMVLDPAWFALTDGSGTMYSVDTEASLYLTATEGSSGLSGTMLEPGQEADFVLAFDVPVTATGLLLSASDQAAKETASGAPYPFRVILE